MADTAIQSPIMSDLPKSNRQHSTTMFGLYTLNTRRASSTRLESPSSADVTRPQPTELGPKMRRALTISTKRDVLPHRPQPQTKSGLPLASGGRMDSLRRAISTSRRRERRPVIQSLFSAMDTDSCESVVNFKPHDRLSEQLGSVHPATSPSASPQPARWLATLPPAQALTMPYMAAYYVTDTVGNLFTADELLAMIENKKTSLWGKLKTHIRGGSYKQLGDTTANLKTFGVPLMTMATREKQNSNTIAPTATRTAALNYVMQHHPAMAVCFLDTSSVPILVQNCILALLQSDVGVEGIFRKNGNIRELNHMCEAIDKFETLQQHHELLDGLFGQSPIQVAALLRRFLRELPEPLLTFKLYKLFLSALRMETTRATKAVLHFACCMLPKPNRDVMQLLFLFLNWVASFHDRNKMHVYNLASVIAPSVLCAPSGKESITDLPQSSPSQGRGTVASDEIQVIAMLIQYQHEFCIVPGEFTQLFENSCLDQSTSDAVDPTLATKEFTRTLVHLIKLNKHNTSVATVASHQPTTSAGDPLSPVPRSLSTPSPIQSSAPTLPVTSTSTEDDVQTPRKQQRQSWVPSRFPA